MISRRQFGLLVLPSAIAVGVGAKYLLSARRSSRFGETPPHPTPRRNPIPIKPASGLEDLVPAARIKRLLQLLAPSWNSLKISRILHALRLWGRDSVFPRTHFESFGGNRVFSGEELLRFFSDESFYRTVAKSDAPLFRKTRSGWRPRYTSGNAASFVGSFTHQDDFLRVAAELGLPTDFQMSASGDVFAVGDLLRASISTFELSRESEWSAEAFARYLAPSNSWVNSRGEAFSFDDLVTTLVAPQKKTRACLETHVVYSLVALLRVHSEYGILSDRSVRKIRTHLERTLTLLSLDYEASKEGYWSGQWLNRDRDTPPADHASPQFFLDLIATGHHLEWIAIAPPDLRPDKAVVQAVALNILETAIDPSTFKSAFNRESAYLGLTHLAGALCMMKHAHPMTIVGLDV